MPPLREKQKPRTNDPGYRFPCKAGATMPGHSRTLVCVSVTYVERVLQFGSVQAEVRKRNPNGTPADRRRAAISLLKRILPMGAGGFEPATSRV
jgi:hypothetical protein